MRILQSVCLGLDKDTPLIIRNDEQHADDATNPINFNFITEIFYMTHLSYSCAVHRLHRMLLKMNEDLSRIQDVFNDVVRSHGGNSDQAQHLEETMSKGSLLKMLPL
jgi:hypothetical protein